VVNEGIWSPAADIPVEVTPTAEPAGAPKRSDPQVSGLAVSPDGRMLYAALGLRNSVAVIDIESGKPTATVPVGVCPYHMLISPDGGTLFVANRGGRAASKDQPFALSGRSRVRIDRTTDAAVSGSISVVDTKTLRVSERDEPRQPAGMAISKDGRFLFVASSNDEHVLKYDLSNGRSRPVVLSLESTDFGQIPTGCALSEDGHTLYTACGGSNSVRVHGAEGLNEMGSMPTGWYPIAIAQRNGTLFVASTKGVGARPLGDPRGYGVHSSVGTVQFIPLNLVTNLAEQDARVRQNNRVGMIEPRSGNSPVPVPARVGDRSLFKHVVYIIKENHTYDLDLGDMPEGNGDKSLTLFGENITPNEHALTRQFVLLDNTYTSGTNSADGHQWVSSAVANAYIEQNYSSNARSYPYDGGDPLAYSPKGFLWTAALKRGLSVKVYGEFVNKPKIEDTTGSSPPSWRALWEDYKSGGRRFKITSDTDNAALKPLLHPNYIGFPTTVSDQWRATQFLNDLAAFERAGDMPAFSMLLLPNNHTVGTRENYPTPRAMVADNDLALGRIVDGITHSKFWKDTLILVIEDDSQMSLDHVDGHRTVAFCVSPYTRRGAVVSEMYNHNSFARTIELVLGIPPMTRFDRTATPLTGCFTENPDLRPYTHQPNRVSLDEMNRPVARLSGRALHLARESARMNIKGMDLADPRVVTEAAWNRDRPGRPFPETRFHPSTDADD
jgi:YVTN family beta-propeller protein